MASSISAGTTSSTALVATADTTGALQLATNNGTVAVTVDTSQNVGVGTTSPDSSNKLQVAGDFAVSWDANKFIGMKFGAGSAYKMGMMLNNTTRECKVWSQSSDSDDKITFYTGPTPSERMRINSSGNVGIGTTSPNFQVSFGANIGKTLAVFENAGTSVYGIGMGGAGTAGDPYRTKLFSNGTENASITDAGVFSFNSGYGSVAKAYGCRAWINFDGTSASTIRGSGNVSSITQLSAGVYNVNLATSMTDANYAVATGVTKGGGGASGTNSAWVSAGEGRSSGYFLLEIYNLNPNAFNAPYVQAAVFR